MHKGDGDFCENLSAELKLIMAFLRMHMADPRNEATNLLAAGPLDWDVFTRLAICHRVHPLIYRCVRTVEDLALPQEVMHTLRWENELNLAKTLQMTGEMLNILRVMEEEGICAIVLKGIPLGIKLYGQAALRPSRDLDILVWPKDVEKARQVIEAQGYARTHPRFTETPVRLRNWMKNVHHFGYWHEDKDICLELHWRVGCQDWDLGKLREKPVQMKVAGRRVLILEEEELLLSLVVHGAVHVWFRLRWLCDIGMMLKQGGFSWERLYALATEVGVKHLLHQAIILAGTILAAPVPEHVALVAANDRKAQKLAAMVLPLLGIVDFNPAELHVCAPWYYHYKKYVFGMQCGWKKRFVYIFSHLKPEERDIGSLSLPTCLYPLYYLTRPLTWFGRQVEYWRESNI